MRRGGVRPRGAAVRSSGDLPALDRQPGQDGVEGGASVPDLQMTLIFSAMIALGSLGVIFMTEAVRLGDMSVVSPFRYTRLLFSMAAGILILGEQVNAIMLFGSTLTILSGLYIWRREILFKQ